MDRQMEGWADGQMDRWIGGQMDGQLDSWTASWGFDMIYKSTQTLSVPVRSGMRRWQCPKVSMAFIRGNLKADVDRLWIPGWFVRNTEL